MCIVLELYLYPVCADLLIARRLSVSMPVRVFSLNTCLDPDDSRAVSLGPGLNSKELYLPFFDISAYQTIEVNRAALLVLLARDT